MKQLIIVFRFYKPSAAASYQQLVSCLNPVFLYFIFFSISNKLELFNNLL